MNTFNIKSPIGWEMLIGGEILVFDTPSGARTVAFEVNTTAPCTVWTSFHEDMEKAVLVAASDGMFTCGIKTAVPIYVEFRSEHGAQMFIKGPAADHRVPSTVEKKYNSVVPQGRRNTEFDRMMYKARLNEKRRDEMLAHTLAEMKAEMKAENARKRAETKVIDDDDTPKPEPKPAPAPEPKTKTEEKPNDSEAPDDAKKD